MHRSIGLLLAGSLFLSLLALHPAGAGSATAPEIADAQHDISLAGNVPGCVNPGQPLPPVCIGDVAAQTFNAGLGGDVLIAWIDGENATSFQINIQTDQDPQAFMQDPANTSNMVAAISFTASMQVNSITQTGVALYNRADGTASVGGGASAVIHNGVLTTLVMPRALFGNITMGTSLTNFTVAAQSLGLGPGAPSQTPAQAAGTTPLFTDSAPDSGAGAVYNFTLNSQVPTGGNGGNNGAPGCTYRSGETNRTDTDADCLPDHWERQSFSNLGQTGTGDPDGDGCNNRCEYLHGSDPTKADTDGDGTNDGDEVDAGTNPTNPGSKPAPGGGPATTTSTSTTSSTTTSSQTTTIPSTSKTTSSSTTSASQWQEALDKIQADSGYAVASGAAMGTVVLVSLIGLFGRWGL